VTAVVSRVSFVHGDIANVFESVERDGARRRRE
jgi:hypothetical protein